MIQRTSQSLWFSIPERGEKCGSFLCSSDMLISISFEIEFLLENVWFISGSG